MKKMKRLFLVGILFSLLLPKTLLAMGSSSGPSLGCLNAYCEIKSNVEIFGDDGVINDILESCDFSRCEKSQATNYGGIVIKNASIAKDAYSVINVDWDKYKNVNYDEYLRTIVLDYFMPEKVIKGDKGITITSEDGKFLFGSKGNGPTITTSGNCKTCTLEVKNFDVEFNGADKNQFSAGEGFTCGVIVGPGNITLSNISIKASDASQSSNPYAICGIYDQNVKIPTLKNVDAKNAKGLLLGFRGEQIIIPQDTEYPTEFIFNYKVGEFKLATLYRFNVSKNQNSNLLDFTHLNSQFFSGKNSSTYPYIVDPNMKTSLYVASFEKVDENNDIVRLDNIFVTQHYEMSGSADIMDKTIGDQSKVTEYASKTIDGKPIAVDQERLPPDSVSIDPSIFELYNKTQGDGEDKEDPKDTGDGEDKDGTEDKKDGGGGQGAPLESGGDGGVTPQGDGGETPVDSGGSCTLINSVNGAVYASLITLLLVMMPSILMRLSAVRSRKR